MHMEAFLWLFLPVFVAGGSALLSYYIMQARMEVALAKERESLAEARATIVSHKITLEERVRATEEASKRKALDDFMQDIRIEERSYVRETKSLDGARKTMVMQERLFFRNIPLSNWIEHEMLVEDGKEQLQVTRESVFSPASLAPSNASQLTAPGTPETRVAITRLLDEMDASHHGSAPPLGSSLGPTVLTPHAAAFGAQ